MEFTIYQGAVEEKDLIGFSQNFNVTRNYMGSRLFPDRKTNYIQAEYSRLCKNGNLTMMAMVHAFDTEANIGSRIPFSMVDVEKLLIKEKTNQTEQLRETVKGMRKDEVRNYIFDDIARTAEKVVARVEKAKMDALALGKFVIDENNLNLPLDYGVPDENRVTSPWNEDSDILGDILTWADIAQANGETVDLAITTRAVVNRIKRNKQIQMQLFGSMNTGMLPTLTQINALLQDQAGIRIEENDAKYGSLAADGKSLEQHRFFPEDTFVMVSTDQNGAIGAGLWGPTPEEEMQGSAFSSKRQQQYVTVTQWAAPDPTAIWTKASGLFVPVIPNPYGHIIANVATADSVSQTIEG